MNNVAASLRQQGKYAEAEAMQRQTLQLKEAVLGKDHPDTLMSMNNLATSLRTVLGKEHPSTLMSMNNLAASLHQQGKNAEAEAMQRQTLQLRETVLGKDHPDTLMSMNNLAESLRQQGMYAEAEAMQQQVL
ncbi:hypothetical protein V501_02084 [Pseudogymnoascus sp. VKM F-4519 (FW-2642)]|nr:hypothetical protein V501_02084 [Pseudogymnoascus sp. VKM F-4519 (FW-2642)]